MDKMKCGDGSLGCTTSGRSDDHTSAVSNSAVSTSAAFGQLFSEAGVGQSGSVRQWTSTEQDFSASFELGELLGTGGFAVVKRGKCPETGEEVAVKIVDRIRYGAQHSQNLEREIALLQRLDHPHLVRLKRVYVSPTRVYIVTELLTGGELLDQLTAREKFPEHDARRMMQQLLQAVEYLHQHGIAHRDLKLENLLLVTPAPDAPLKIADFGLSKCFLDDPLRTICGSPQYVAPEVLTTGLLRASYSCAADLWSLGVVLFILLAGFSPFDDDNEARMFERIRGGCYSLEGPPWQGVSRPARDLVRRLLCVDPKRRLTAAEALLHPWISSPGATPAGGAGAAASSPEQLKFKVSPRRPTVRGLDKLVLQSRSPNQSSPESPGRSPRSPQDEGAKSTMPSSPNCSPRPLRPDAGRSTKSPSSGASSPRSNGEHSGGRVGGWRDGPASPRSPRVSSPLGKAVGPTEFGVSRSKETNNDVIPSRLSVQINKLLR